MAQAAVLGNDIQMSLSEIEIHRDDVIGRGGFGHVYRAYHIKKGLVAVKMLISEGTIPKRNIHDLEKEAKRLKESNDHPNIVNLLGILMEPNHYGLVLEYMHLGASSTFVRDYKVEKPLKLRLVSQVIEAMTYLHSHRPAILHLDLKADNVLVDKDLNAKICDFGLSEWKTVTMTMTKEAGVNSCQRRCTITHIAPEILKNINGPSTKLLDVYAFGVTTWEIFSGLQPFEGKGEDLIRQSVISSQRPDMDAVSPDCPLQVKSMIRRCWHQTPGNRPEFRALKNEIRLIYPAYESGLTHAIKSIRTQITEQHAPNDDIYFGTDHLDDLENSMGTDSTDSSAVAMEVDDPQNSAAAVSPELSLLPPPRQAIPPQKTPISPALNCCRYRDPSSINFAYKQLTEDDKQVRRVLLNPLAVEMINSGKIDDLQLSPRARHVFRSLESVHEYINSDWELQLLLLRSNSPILSNWNSPKSHDAMFHGETLQQEKKLDGALRCLNYRTRFRNVDSMNKREKRRYERYRVTQRSRYAWRKLGEVGTCQKLMKALRSPGELKRVMKEEKERMRDGRAMSASGLFTLMDKEVFEALRDPMIVQILLTLDAETRDRLMTDNPDVLMWLLSQNRTEYPGVKQVDVPRQMGGTGYSRMSTDHLQGKVHAGIGSYTASGRVDQLKDQPMSGSRAKATEENKMEEESSGGFFRRLRDGISHYTSPSVKNTGSQSGTQTVKEAGTSRTSTNQSSKVDEKRKSKPDVKNVLHENLLSPNMKIKQEPVKQEDASYTARNQTAVKAGTQNPVQYGSQYGQGASRINYPPLNLNTTCAMAAAQTNKSKYEEEMSRMHISVPYMDKMSMDQYPSDDTTISASSAGSQEMGTRNGRTQDLVSGSHELSSRSHRSPEVTRAAVQGADHLPPRPEGQGQRHTLTAVPPEPRQDSHKNGKRETKKEKVQQPDTSKKPPKKPTSPPPPTGGATGGASGTSRPTTISHKHAGGGFTQVTFNPNARVFPNMQIGNRMTMVVNNANDDSDEEYRPKKKPKKKVKLPKSEMIPTLQQIDVIANEIGRDWKKLCREMELGEAEIEQLHEDFHINGTYEIAYQAIQRWIQRNSRAATLTKMAQFLNNLDRVDLIKKL